MVKLGSPFGLPGVVDSSFKRLGGGKSQQVEAHQKDGLRQGEFPLATPAGSPCPVIPLARGGRVRFGQHCHHLQLRREALDGSAIMQ